MTVYKNINIDGTCTDIVSENGIIKNIGRTNLDGIDFGGKKVYAGLVDIHTHGIGGIDTMDGNLSKMAKLWAENGTTTFFPTTMTVPYERIHKILNAEVPKMGAKIAGFHLEGPFINENHGGAQNRAYIKEPDFKEFSQYNNIKIITIAPELNGAEEFIRKSKAVISLGHTDADYDTGVLAAEAGARCITHIFNAMLPLHHRQPALVGAAYDKDMYIQVICDGKHIHPSVIRMLYKLFGAGRMALISDSMRAALMDDGKYEFGGMTVVVKNKIARTEDGALAGSTSTLFDCVKTAISFGIPEKDAFKMASETPAKLMNLKCGVLKEGYECDFIVLNEDYEIDSVVISGELYHKQ